MIMSRMVVKLAQPGFDVKTAGDENLIYNSNWPLLKIYKTGSFTSNNIGATLGIITEITQHDLGYVPMFWIYSNQPIESWSLTQTAALGNRSDYIGQVNFVIPTMSRNRLTITSNVSSLNNYISFRYYIFALDLDKQYTAPIIKVGNQTAGKRGKSVFKLAKSGKDINSPNLNDYAIHSDARSPLIHSVNPGIVNEDIGGGSYAFTIYHNLGYAPMFFGYLKGASGSYTQTATGGGGTTKFTADEQKVRYQSTANGQALTIVILKDPFEIDFTVNVTI